MSGSFYTRLGKLEEEYSGLTHGVTSHTSQKSSLVEIQQTAKRLSTRVLLASLTKQPVLINSHLIREGRDKVSQGSLIRSDCSSENGTGG